jgi:hypothetical protein
MRGVCLRTKVDSSEATWYGGTTESVQFRAFIINLWGTFIFSVMPPPEVIPTLKKLKSDLRRRFPDEESCRVFLESVRWPEGVRCPRCLQVVAICSGKALYRCKGCGDHRFRAITNFPPFAKGHVKLREWLELLFIDARHPRRFTAEAIHSAGGPCAISIRRMRARIRKTRRTRLFRELMQLISGETTDLKMPPIPVADSRDQTPLVPVDQSPEPRPTPGQGYFPFMLDPLRRRARFR